MMSTISEYRDIDRDTQWLARDCSLVADHAGMSLHTHFQQEVTIVEVSGAVLMHHELSDIPAKQIHRWEGEGGFIPPEHDTRGSFTRRSRIRDRFAGEGKAVCRTTETEVTQLV
ncbi:hypothetical protein ACQI5H_12085 [Mycobacterium heidelbergense]|uniref:hypothetical protein n=1 Tax=Mycobacterium heidelbergense TaxID=53376 RepID=UPI003CF73FBF